MCTASDINQMQTLQYVSSARARRALVHGRYRTIYGRHDIVRLTNPRSISRYRVIDMITRCNMIRDSSRVQFPSFPHLRREYQRSCCLTSFCLRCRSAVTLNLLYYNDESHVVQLIQYVGCLAKLVRSTGHTANLSHSQVVKRPTCQSTCLM